MRYSLDGLNNGGSISSLSSQTTLLPASSSRLPHSPRTTLFRFKNTTMFHLLNLIPCLEQTIPIAFFLKHVQGRNDHIKIAKLTTAASDKTWTVKMDGFKLTHGWEDFAVAHDLRVGDMIVFRHEGELVFHVTTMGPSCCEIQYTHNINHNHTNNIIESSSSDNSLFVAKVSASNLRLDRLVRLSKIYLNNSFTYVISELV